MHTKPNSTDALSKQQSGKQFNAKSKVWIRDLQSSLSFKSNATQQSSAFPLTGNVVGVGERQRTTFLTPDDVYDFEMRVRTIVEEELLRPYQEK